MAVQLFFIVSGFVISFILVELKSYSTVTSFYENRVLRLFPIYLVVALGTLAMYLSSYFLLGNATPFQEVYQNIDTNGKALLILSNIFIFGQDWVMFTAVHDGLTHLHYDFQDSDLPVWQGLLVPPAWSLGVELTFYLIAPFILHRLGLLAVLLIGSVAVRIWLASLGLTELDQWNYRFFPSELAFFIAGALAHQIWMPRAKAMGLLAEKIATPVTYLSVGMILIFVTLDAPFPRWGMIALFIFALPFLFAFQKNNRWDRTLGELSYPIYISHWSIMFVGNIVWDRLKEPGYQGYDETFAILIATVIVSLLLKKVIADPLELTRDRVRSSNRTELKNAGQEGA